MATTVGGAGSGRGAEGRSRMGFERPDGQPSRQLRLRELEQSPETPTAGQPDSRFEKWLANVAIGRNERVLTKESQADVWATRPPVPALIP